MIFPDLLPELIPLFPQLRGSLSANEPLAPYTWFRVGGPAQLFYLPADEDDLVYFLRNLPREIPVTVIGLGSNLIIRDGGVAGVVIRLSAKGFGAVCLESNQRLRIGAATPDIKAARAAAEAEPLLQACFGAVGANTRLVVLGRRGGGWAMRAAPVAPPPQLR